jgi:hypothetical protein
LGYDREDSDCTIIDRNGDNLGVQVVAGFGGPGDWGQFDGNVDAFQINGATYNLKCRSRPRSGSWRSAE